MTKIFKLYTRPARKTSYRILILDGHGSHHTPEFLEFCENHRIVLLGLPPHTSHMLQPLDIAVFSPTKHYYRRAVDNRLRLRDIRIPKADFLEIYCETRPKSITAHNVQAGFHGAGLVPFNPATALRKLPIPTVKPPNPVILSCPQTPKTTNEL